MDDSVELIYLFSDVATSGAEKVSFGQSVAGV